MYQQTLFDDPVFEQAQKVKVLHRRNSGGGSEAAAEKMVQSGELGRQQAEVLEVVRMNAAEVFPRTAKEIAERHARVYGADYHVTYEKLRRRLGELYKAGKVGRTGTKTNYRWWALEG